MTGFIENDQARGRPVGVGIDGTGALLVADDSGNTVWRVANADGTVIPQPIGTDQTAATAQQAATTDKTDRAPVAAVSPPANGTTGSTEPALAAPTAPAEERLTGQAPVSGKSDTLQPSQTDIAPAARP